MENKKNGAQTKRTYLLIICRYSLKHINIFRSDRGREYDNIKIDDI